MYDPFSPAADDQDTGAVHTAGPFDQNTPTRPRIPKPQQVVQGGPGDPTAIESHGTPTWSTTGGPQGGTAGQDPSAHPTQYDAGPMPASLNSSPFDPSNVMAGIPKLSAQQPQQAPPPQQSSGGQNFYSGVTPPDFSQRPGGGIPQIGRQNSILGALTGMIGGMQAKKQQDWDVKNVQPYNEQMALAKGQTANQYEMGRLDQANRSSLNRLQGVLGSADTRANASMYNSDNRSDTALGVANIGASSRENVANTRGDALDQAATIGAKGRTDAAGIAAGAHVQGAQIGADSKGTGSTTTSVIDPASGKATSSKVVRTFAAKPAASSGLSNFHVNPKTGQRIGQTSTGDWVDATTGKPVQ